jgi:general secretion pathway protein M
MTTWNSFSNSLGKGLRTWWTERDAREKKLLASAALLIALASVWLLAVAPALKTLRQFDATHNAQEAQLNTMRALQAQAQSLQAKPQLSANAASKAVQTATEKAFGTQADITFAGGSATIQLRNVSPEALAQWLTSVRSQAHATPMQARIARDPASTPTKSAAGSSMGWSGSVQLALPTN